MGCVEKGIAQTIRPRKARRVRNTYAGRDSSTSDSESPEENMARALHLHRKKFRPTVRLSDVPYVPESSSYMIGAQPAARLKVPGSKEEEIVEQQEHQFQNFEDKASKRAGEKDQLLAALASVFRNLLAVKDNSDGITRFHAVKAPSMSISEYLKRLDKYFDCSDSCLLTSLIYIDRIIKEHSAFPICDRTIHRIVGVSLMVAAKFLDDVFYANTYYAKVAGLTVKEINSLECEFLRLLSFKCDVSPQDYEKYYKQVMYAYRKCNE